MTTSDLSHRSAATERGAPGLYRGAAVVQLVSGPPGAPGATVEELHPTTLVVTATRIAAMEGGRGWSWMVDDLVAVHHAAAAPWTILVVPGIEDHGVAVRPEDVEAFRARLAQLRPDLTGGVPDPEELLPWPDPEPPAADEPWRAPGPALGPDPTLVTGVPDLADLAAAPAGPDRRARPTPAAGHRGRRGLVAGLRERVVRVVQPAPGEHTEHLRSTGPASLDARSVSAWFGTHHVLDRVSLTMAAGDVTALIGPSGCGKSTFLRILNRMHEMIPSASLAGEVLLDGGDIYDPERRLTDARRQIGMVFQKPNPFPAMSIYDNVVASLRLTGTKADSATKDELVETCLSKAGLWKEVRDRLRQPGGSLSGGQQQRLCIARALAIRPLVLLMDEPCSALDPTSTRRIEQTIAELAEEVTIVIVTHNMQQALRVSDRCAFFLAEHGTPGVIVEHGPTDDMFHRPQDPRTDDYVNGRFG
jgi:phosphate transport system ATP-binding protein